MLGKSKKIRETQLFGAQMTKHHLGPPSMWEFHPVIHVMQSHYLTEAQQSLTSVHYVSAFELEKVVRERDELSKELKEL